MTLSVGQPVTLKTSSVSKAGGLNVSLNKGRKGRVCKMYPGGFCCVQFGGPIGCRRVSSSRLEPAIGPAPPCSTSCTRGCW